MDAICKVTILGWDAPQPTFFHVWCNRCDRLLGSFSKRESAEAWIDAHIKKEKHT